MRNAQIIQVKRYFFATVLLVIAASLQAQLKIVPAKSTVVVSGTSTMHDWDMKVAQVNGSVDASASKLNALVISIPVKSLKSTKGSIMDGKAYDAFNEKKNPLIVFTLTDAAPIKISDENVEVVLSGTLSMGGSTRKVIFKSTGKVIAKGFQMKGALPLKMSDFGMKAPSLLFVKTGDAVVVKFDVTVEGSL